MKPTLTQSTARLDLLSRKSLRCVSMWLLSLVLMLGLVLGQSAEAGSIEDPHSDISFEIEGVFGQGTASAPACHPGLICTGFVLPKWPVTALTLSVVIVLLPVLTQSQHHYGGPSVTLPPPRALV